MKALLKILLGGFVVFMSLSIAQEWEFFSSAWFGEAAPQAPLSDDERKGAADAVHMTLSLMRHLYLSGGDVDLIQPLLSCDSTYEPMIIFQGMLTADEDCEY